MGLYFDWFINYWQEFFKSNETQKSSSVSLQGLGYYSCLKFHEKIFPDIDRVVWKLSSNERKCIIVSLCSYYLIYQSKNTGEGTWTNFKTKLLIMNKLFVFSLIQASNSEHKLSRVNFSSLKNYVELVNELVDLLEITSRSVNGWVGA